MPTAHGADGRGHILAEHLEELLFLGSGLSSSLPHAAVRANEKGEEEASILLF